MSEKKIVVTKKAPAAVGTYSQGVVLNGVHYFSGQIGLNPETMELADTFENQLNQVMANIDGLLESCNLKRENIVKTSIFLVDLSEFPKVNKVYEEYFQSPYPARSCVQVPALPKGALIEIEAIASI